MQTFETKIVNKVSGIEHKIYLHAAIHAPNKLSIHLDGRSGFGQVNRSGRYYSIREDINECIKENHAEIMTFFNK